MHSNRAISNPANTCGLPPMARSSQSGSSALSPRAATTSHARSRRALILGLMSCLFAIALSPTGQLPLLANQPPASDTEPSPAPAAAAPETPRASDPAPSPSTPAEPNLEPQPAPPESPERAAPTSAALPPNLLDVTIDRTRSVRAEEYDAYYQTLAHARDVPLSLQQRAAAETLRQARERFAADPKNERRKFSLFVDLVTHPDLYRGQLVTLRGHLQGIESFKAGENDLGLTDLHQAWLYTEDGLGNPYTIVCSEIPKDLPLPRRGSATDHVVVTGYFFKLWAYNAQRGVWGAPMILAHRLEWKPLPPPDNSQVQMIAAVVGTIIILGTGLLLWSWSREARTPLRQLTNTTAAEDEMLALNALRNLEADRIESPANAPSDAARSD